MPDKPADDGERIEFKPITMEMTFHDVDPELLGVITGGVMGTPPSPTFSVTINSPVKRTFWQWLRRRPRRWQQIYIPHATMGEPDA